METFEPHTLTDCQWVTGYTRFHCRLIQQISKNSLIPMFKLNVFNGKQTLHNYIRPYLIVGHMVYIIVNIQIKIRIWRYLQHWKLVQLYWFLLVEFSEWLDSWCEATIIHILQWTFKTLVLLQKNNQHIKYPLYNTNTVCTTDEHWVEVFRKTDGILSKMIHSAKWCTFFRFYRRVKVQLFF